MDDAPQSAHFYGSRKAKVTARTFHSSSNTKGERILENLSVRPAAGFEPAYLSSVDPKSVSAVPARPQEIVLHSISKYIKGVQNMVPS